MSKRNRNKTLNTEQQKNADSELPVYKVVLTNKNIFGESDDKEELDIEKMLGSSAPDYYRESKIFQETIDNIFDFAQKESNRDWHEKEYDPFEWSMVYEIDTRIKQAILIRVGNSVSNGWSIECIKEKEKMTPEELSLADRQKAELTKLFDNGDEPFTERSEKLRIDEESTGDGYFEVVRDIFGTVIKIDHKKSVFIRKRSKKGEKNPGYVYIKPYGNRLFGKEYKKEYYKEFGDKRIMNRETGEFNPSTPVNLQATELLNFSIYGPGDLIYGIPRAVSTKHAIQGNYYAGVQNVSLLKNDATPRMAVLVENGTLDPSSVNFIENFFKIGNKGPENEGRVLVLQPEKKRIGLPNQNIPPTKINIVPLTLGIIDDASFQKLRENNNSEKAEAIGVPELMLGSTDGSGKAASNSVVKLFHEQIVFPDIKKFNERINSTIVKDKLRLSITVSLESEKDLKTKARYSDEDISKVEELDFFNKLEYLKQKMFETPYMWVQKEIDDRDSSNIKIVFENTPLVKFSLTPPTVTDPLEQARVARLYHELASLTPNDVVRERGQDEYDEEWADRPVAITTLMLKHGVPTEVVFGPGYEAKVEEKPSNSPFSENEKEEKKDSLNEKE